MDLSRRKTTTYVTHTYVTIQKLAKYQHPERQWRQAATNTAELTGDLKEDGARKKRGLAGMTSGKRDDALIARIIGNGNPASRTLP